MPKVDLETSAKTAKKIALAIEKCLVASCHDCSEGGLAVGLAEMAFAGGLGIEADLRGLAKSDDCTRIEAQLFSESNSRYIVEVEPEKFDAFAKLMLNLPFGQIGEVVEEKKLIIRSAEQNTVIHIKLQVMKEAWQKPLNLG